MIVSSRILLCAIIIQGTYGTFPPVNDPPPIPSQAVRGFQPQNFNVPEDLPQFPPPPKEERFFPPDRKPDEERWYYEENQSRGSRNRQKSFETSDRYYQRGEPAIGPVATPIPDDTYLAQSSSVSRLNPTNIQNRDNTRILIITSNAEGQYRPERWIEVQVPDERFIEVVNQDSGVPVATDTVKSIVAPSPIDIPPQGQFSSNPTINIVQARQANPVGFQKIYTNSRTVVENTSPVKQFVDAQSLPPLNVQNIKPQFSKDVPPVALPSPVTAQISSKSTFVVPPPPPPPLKGVDTPPKVLSTVPVSIVSDSNVVIPGKNVIPDSNIVPGKSVVQQIRHVWIPTSAKTGKFITIPVRSVNSGKTDASKGFSLDSTPVTVSDTWVLKQDGPVPVFEQQKSSLSPSSSPIVQSGKVIFESPTIVQVDGPQNPVITKVDVPKNVPVAETIFVPNTPRDIWPARKAVTNDKSLNTYSPVFISDLPTALGKSDAVVNGKYVSETLQEPQKTIVTDIKSGRPPPIPSPNVQIVNGKPCPLPLPVSRKDAFPPLNNNGIIALQRIVPTQRRLPFARIIRVNRYPMGSYYLLNRNIRPSYYMYPNQAVVQPNAGLINIVRTKELPVQLQRKAPLPTIQTRQISIPVQSKQIAPSLSGKSVTYPFASRQVILPLVSPKSARIFYPSVQAIRTVGNPWNGNLKSNPVFYKDVYGPEFGLLKAVSVGSDSESSSSESSSEEDSSESSKEKKEEKKAKVKKEEKPKSNEESKSSESEREVESDSKSKENESKEKSLEKESGESLETSQSQTSLSYHRTNDGTQSATNENKNVNSISSHGAEVSEKADSSEESSK